MDSNAVFEFEVPTRACGTNDRSFKSTALVQPAALIRRSAAAGAFHHRARASARIGLPPELGTIDAVLAAGIRLRDYLGEGMRPLEPQRLEFSVDGPVEFFRGVPPSG